MKNELISSRNLPPLGLVVKALCRWTTPDWEIRLFGKKKEVFNDTFLLRRIKSENELGWHWSNAEIKTTFTLEVISFEFINEIKK